MRKLCEILGDELTKRLGFENKTVIRYWTAFEKEKWLKCRIIYQLHKKK